MEPMIPEAMHLQSQKLSSHILMLAGYPEKGIPKGLPGRKYRIYYVCKYVDVFFFMNIYCINGSSTLPGQRLWSLWLGGQAYYICQSSRLMILLLTVEHWKGP